MNNIDKLREKVAKEPTSTLFVPLADEYRKAGMLDEAIDVLKAGIERQPNYMSARVALGKIYLEKQMLKEAREEFAKVASAIPDNLFAHRKLADIYRELGDKKGAISRYETVLSLNPRDEEAQAILDGLRSEAQEPEVEEEVPEEPPPASVEEEMPYMAPLSEDETAIVGLEAAPDWASSIGGEGEVQPAAVFFHEEDSEDEGGDEGGMGVVLEEDASAAGSELEALSEPGTAEEEVLDEAGTEDIEAAGLDEAPGAVPETPHAFSSDDTVLPDLSEADDCIQSENYMRAIEIYNKYLSREPENGAVLQRVRELKSLLKLLGKEDVLYTEKLQGFLNAVKRRRDEFYRGA